MAKLANIPEDSAHRSKGICIHAPAEIPGVSSGIHDDHDFLIALGPSLERLAAVSAHHEGIELKVRVAHQAILHETLHHEA